MTPTRFVALYWCLVLIATITLYQDSFWLPSGLLAIGIAVIVFTLGVLAANLSPSFAQKKHAAVLLRSTQVDAKPIVALVLVGSLSNLSAGVLALRVAHLSLLSLASPQGLLSSANSISVFRYENGGLGIRMIPVLLGIGYAAAAVTPFLMLTKVVRRRWVMIVAPSASSLVFAAISTQRLGFVLSIATTLASYFAVEILTQGRPPILRWRNVVAAGLVAVFLALGFVGIAFLRVGRTDVDAVKAVGDRQVVYTLGGVPAFSQWLDTYRATPVESQHLWYGTASLAGMEYVTGLHRNETRGYGDFTQVDPTGRTTNVYTALRSLVLDFGLAGSVLAVATFGFIFGRLYVATKAGSVSGSVGLAYGYTLILLSPWLAVSTFSNVVAAGLLALSTILYASKVVGTRASHRLSRNTETVGSA